MPASSTVVRVASACVSAGRRVVAGLHPQKVDDRVERGLDRAVREREGLDDLAIGADGLPRLRKSTTGTFLTKSAEASSRSSRLYSSS